MTDEYQKEDDEEYEDDEVSSESEDEYEDEADDAEASDESETDSEDEDSVASWGYEEKKSRFSKEVIAGFAAVALLVTIFGVVVYKKFPGADSAAETIAAGPDVSLGSPGESGSESDPDDPFAPDSEQTLGMQSEPNPDGVTGDDALAGSEFGTKELTTTDGTAGSLTDPALLTGDSAGSLQTTSGDPFAGNTNSGSLFADQSEPAMAGEPADSFGTSASTDQFGAPLASNAAGSLDSQQPEPFSSQSGSPADERRSVFGNPSTSLADSSSADPFATPDLSGSSAASGISSDPLGTYDSGNSGTAFGNTAFPDSTEGSLTGSPTTESGISDPIGADPFAPGSDLVQSEPTIDSSSSGLRSDPLGTASGEPLASDPFGSTVDAGNSQPGGLFDRSPGASLTDSSLDGSSASGLSNGSENDIYSPGAMTGRETENFDGSPGTSVADPFGSSEPGGVVGNGVAGDLAESSLSGSPSVVSDSLGSAASSASSEPSSGNPFGSVSEEPTSLFPDNGNAGATAGTASTDPFQPPLTSSPAGRSPVTLSTDLTGAEPFPASSSNRNAGSSGTYTVQEGDSYWSISKKIYGTAKYFQVLADHNSRTIADPQKMKAGAVIQTPDASVLQRQMKTVRRTAPTGLTGSIETNGRADRSRSADSSASSEETTVVSRRPAVQEEPSGILFNQQGYPMFRIGETDTLTSIAADHLGRASRWEQIYNMNRDQLQSPDKLHIGMLLKLPADASRVPLIDRTSSLR